MAKAKVNKVKIKKRRSNLYHGTYELSQLDYKILTPPSKHSYSPINTPMIAYRLCLLGFSKRELATALGIAYKTYKKWMKAYPYFAEWVSKGSIYADALVANALFKCATGYVVRDTKFFMDKGTVLTVDYDKHVLPDYKAATHWLNNRQAKYWKSETNLNKGIPSESTPVINIKISPSGIPAITSEKGMVNYDQELDSTGFYKKIQNGNGK